LATEFRRVTFTNSELLSAILAHCRATQRTVRLGEGTTCTIDDDASVIVSTETFDIGADMKTVEQTRLDSNEVGAALLRYCMALRIPIPRLSQKSLQVTGDSISIVICLDSGDATVPFA
jgi:hypothetical protein